MSKEEYRDINRERLMKQIEDSVREVAEPWIGKTVGQVDPEKEAKKIANNLKRFYEIVAPELNRDNITVTPSDKDGVYNISVPLPYFRFIMDLDKEKEE